MADAPGMQQSAGTGGTINTRVLQEEEYEENLAAGEILWLPYHSALLQGTELPAASPAVSQLTATQSPPSQDVSPGTKVEQAEEEDAIGPDGYGGYHHVAHLAKALVELRHHAFVTRQQATEITSLWNKLSDRDKAPVKYAPSYRDRQGHFNVSRRRSHIPSMDTLRRAFLGQGAGAPMSPKASRLVEAVLLQLCYLHQTGTRTLAGGRISRWAVITRDYGIIQGNVYNNPHLMAHTRLQLFDVNQRTLTLWFNQQEKERRAKCASFSFLPHTASMTAAEPLTAARTLQEETRTDSRLFQPRLPADPSGLSVTPTAASDPDASPPANLSTTRAASASSTATPASAPDSSTTTTAACAALTTAIAAPDSSTTTTAASAPASSTVTVGRTTAWRIKVHEEKVQRAREAGITMMPYRRLSHFNCRHCGQPKNKKHGHSLYRMYGWFCAKAEGRPLQEWLAEKKREKAAAAAAASSVQAQTAPTQTQTAAAASSILFLVFPTSVPPPPPF